MIGNIGGNVNILVAMGNKYNPLYSKRMLNDMHMAPPIIILLDPKPGF